MAGWTACLAATAATAAAGPTLALARSAGGPPTLIYSAPSATAAAGGHLLGLVVQPEARKRRVCSWLALSGNAGGEADDLAPSGLRDLSSSGVPGS